MLRFFNDMPLGVQILARSCVGYAVGIVVLSAVAVWGSASIGTTFLRMLEAKIIDGSGQAPTLTQNEAPESSTPPAIADATQSTPAPAAPESSAAAAQAIRASFVARPITDPDKDPAAAYHNGETATYRTFCVRLCDGYFWPVSFSTTANRFDKDEAACASSCNSPARLFVHKMPGGGPATMTSLAGVPYAALKTAFLFRAQYDAQCTCHVQPWQQEAQDRHRLYAAKALATKGNSEAEANVRQLQDKLTAEQSVASAALTEARQRSDRELHALAKATQAKPVTRTAASRDAQETRNRTQRQRLARATDSERSGTVMRLGAISGTQGSVTHLGWHPASGTGRGWRERVFTGN